MSLIYKTSEGEMLDWICWRHYGQRSRLDEAASQVEPRLKEEHSTIGNDIMVLGQQGQGDMQGIVEMVLEANPGLADYGPALPSGVQILLPDYRPEVVESGVVHLWD